MADQPAPHADMAGYLAGSLEPAERARFEQHLEGCLDCRAALRELAPLPELMDRMAPAHEPPADLEERTLAAVRRAAGEHSAAPSAEPRRPVHRQRSWWPRLGLAAGLAVALAAAVLAGTQLGNGDDEPGTLELRAALSPPGGGNARANAEVRNTGTGRVIGFRSDDLPILPTGELYELWFVGPGDTAARPNRISAGTFHPDEDGRSRVRLHAAVDPAEYPVLSVTAEPGDGNPSPDGPEVLRSRAGGP